MSMTIIVRSFNSDTGSWNATVYSLKGSILCSARNREGLEGQIKRAIGTLESQRSVETSQEA